ncbi:hypothetical protein [Tellurirhabdus rosea]|uniref:hypothetical protein n=1 Tax=Tellurirhabdus rosea TaxID=2674997 RepID=UPI002254BD56|nr:hypothetical protein [Tellurirhabdus rosea]
MAAKTEKAAEKKPAAKAKKSISGEGASKSPAARKSSKKDDSNYTDLALREKLKNKIMEGDKGGKPGQWSARKAQLLKKEYEEAGGGYHSSKKTESQKSLQKWTDEDWQTSDGKEADRKGGTTRYLPKEAWDKLSPEEKKATNVKKQTASRAGKPRAANTKAASKARKEAKS